MSRTHRTPSMPERLRCAVPRSRIGGIVGRVLLLAALALLAACGGAPSSRGITVPRPTGTAASLPYAYLYSRVDYPLELAVDAGSTVTLTLSSQQNLLMATPSAGNGVATLGEPIPLPTRLQDYADIGASIDTEASGESPVVWQLISAPRQSLLTPGGSGISRAYRPSVAFQWHVQAVAPGRNLVQIILHLYYIYLDGSEHDGTIEVSGSPTPVLAVQPAIGDTPLPTWLSGWLSTWRLPLAGLSGLAGLLGVLRFLWDVLQNAREAKEAADTATKAAAAIHAHVSRRRQG